MNGFFQQRKEKARAEAKEILESGGNDCVQELVAMHKEYKQLSQRVFESSNLRNFFIVDESSERCMQLVSAFMNADRTLHAVLVKSGYCWGWSLDKKDLEKYRKPLE
jgi:hypothetical protein